MQLNFQINQVIAWRNYHLGSREDWHTETPGYLCSGHTELGCPPIGSDQISRYLAFCAICEITDSINDIIVLLKLFADTPVAKSGLVYGDAGDFPGGPVGWWADGRGGLAIGRFGSIPELLVCTCRTG